ncbi:MAG: amidohydrolase family protein [Pseudomonadota bacterium]
MPDFPIIDTHLHIWDMDRLSYSAFKGHPLFGRTYTIEGYQKATAELDIEAMVFVECFADFDAKDGHYIEEIHFVEESAERDDRIRGIVPMAPLEKGHEALPMLEQMQKDHPTVKGIRRIMEFDDDPRGLTLSPQFIEGVNLLAEFGWHFEINVNHTQMDIIREFVRHIPDVPLILDHCGKPGIREGKLDQYRSDIADLASHPNMWCKLSDLPPYADPDNWTDSDIRPYIDATFETFGFGRTIYAGDWPICLLATSLPRWVEVLDTALEGVPEADRRCFYRDNANQFYRLGL